ncbi:restriction endonuclease subunit S [Levilactobacillus brevis]|uniref:restriction endonuclease subunit S n=2 Tax=Levilactobacillus brevis TaxID=1580 RepID=UPI002935EC02|nr:restriction endonuclease subunit S [Levilactobacillus brevis]MDV2566250.1 restriction endonuclease subunit S [Levilactobacillus brevis]MDV2584478.1 restriction endonuclease subunit S [Levilactobacillus brevis]
MKDNQAKYPQLRFKGFTNPWEKRRLGERFAERVDRSGDGEMLSVTIANGVVLANSLDRKDNSSSDKSNYKVVKKDDIAYNSMRMWQAASGVSKYDGIVSPAYTVLVPANGESSTFFGYQFKQTEMKQIFQRNSQGLTSDTWNLKYPLLSRIKTSAPERTEQIKIGEFLTKLDNLIAVNQRKLAKLKELKQGYLQKMFPQNGSKFPQLRFAGFADAWEERKLGQYTKLITKGTTPKDKTGIGDVNFVKVENITNGKIYPINKIKQHEHDNYLKRSRLEEKDILFSIAGTLGRTAIVNKSILPANTNQALAIIRGYDFDTNFLITSLAGNVVKEYIRRNPTVGAQPNLSLEQVGNLLVNTPNAEEQQKIGSFFKQLDDTIALHQRKLEKLQELKKGYLQKMFC